MTSNMAKDQGNFDLLIHDLFKEHTTIGDLGYEVCGVSIFSNGP